MSNQKGNTSTQEESVLDIANQLLKRGMFKEAKDFFLKLEDSENYSLLARIGIKLCEYKVSSINVEETTKFLKSIMELAIEKNDVVLYKDVYVANTNAKGEYLNLQYLIELILKHFNLSNSLEKEELKEFISEFKEIYLYYDVLENIIRNYIQDRKFDEALYFINEAFEAKVNSHKVLFYRILCTLKSKNEEELLKSNVDLGDVDDFQELLLCSNGKDREYYIDLSVKQVAYRQHLIEQENQKRELERIEKERKQKRDREKFEAGMSIFLTGLKDFGLPILFVLLCWGFILVDHFFIGDILGLILAVVIPIAFIVSNLLIHNDKVSKYIVYHLVMIFLMFCSLLFYMYVSASEPIWGFEEGYVAWGFWNYMGEGEYGWLFLMLPYVIPVVLAILLLLGAGDKKFILPILGTSLVLSHLPLVVNLFNIDIAREVGVVVMWVAIPLGTFVAGVVGENIDISCDDFFDFFKEYIFPFVFVLISWGFIVINHLFIGEILGLVLAVVVPIGLGIGYCALFDCDDNDRQIYHYVMLILIFVSVVFYMTISASESIWGFEEGVVAWGFWNYFDEGEYGWLFLMLPYVIPVVLAICLLIFGDRYNRKYVLPMLVSTLVLSHLPLVINLFGWGAAREIGVIVMWVLIPVGLLIGYLIGESLDISCDNCECGSCCEDECEVCGCCSCGGCCDWLKESELCRGFVILFDPDECCCMKIIYLIFSLITILIVISPIIYTLFLMFAQ